MAALDPVSIRHEVDGEVTVARGGGWTRLEWSRTLCEIIGENQTARRASGNDSL